ncbi:MAG: pilus assembly PilX N-terminal domain-containing protein [Gammaproteobacteria bacterium]|nr:pilus assembly PilX N-terminal domain-containing protein [Gammaproteobacteria bacterium]
MSVTIRKGVPNQKGASLIVGLILLAVLMIVGVVAVQNGIFQERMAANIHQSNWVFAAADSGIGAFNNMAVSGNELDPDHILLRANLSGSVSFCVDENGEEADCTAMCDDGTGTMIPCDGARLDGNSLQVAVSVQSLGCRNDMCFGYSIGQPGSPGCLVFQVNSVGSAEGMNAEVEWYGFQLSSACSSIAQGGN